MFERLGNKRNADLRSGFVFSFGLKGAMAGIRVISGKAKGKRLQMVPGEIARPIPDRVKESLFNIIGTDIKEASFLDIFAGTGSVGIEALSRGAATVTFFEMNRLAIKTVRENIATVGFGEESTVMPGDAFRLLQSKAVHGFDYVYIAPPQYQRLWIDALQTLEQHTDWMNPDAWVIVQIHPREYEELNLDVLEEFDQRKYGNTLLVFYEYIMREPGREEGS